MRERSATTDSRQLAGSLLLAHPALRETIFRHSVILLSNHNRDGAMGVVLNRPLHRNLGELDGAFALGPLASVPVHVGGPVGTDQLILAAWRIDGDGFQLHFGLEPDRAIQLATEEDMAMRAFRGYSGWSGGQLENELRHQTWATLAVPANLMEHPHDDTLWRRLLSRMGWKWRLMADEPDDPARN